VRHFLGIDQIGYGDLREIIDNALLIKEARKGFSKGHLDVEPLLSGQMVALIFEKPSTRTRTSFDVGVKQMGGQTLLLNGSDLQLGHGESILDTAKVLSRYVDLIMIRTFAEATLHELADNSEVPIINGLTDASHPCQIMADIMTFEEKRGPISGKKVLWIGDGNNVCSSFIHASVKFGFSMGFSGPEKLKPCDKLLQISRKKGSDVHIHKNLNMAVKDADLIVTDSWVSMHHSKEERVSLHNELAQYQVNAELMSRAKPDTIFMHCLPAHRGEEVTSEVLDGNSSVVFDEAENRLHVQKAIMKWCLNK
jgi:ornithine carbamoyltransferase